jgi:hypothetical protein
MTSDDCAQITCTKEPSNCSTHGVVCAMVTACRAVLCVVLLLCAVVQGSGKPS